MTFLPPHTATRKKPTRHRYCRFVELGLVLAILTTVSAAGAQDPIGETELVALVLSRVPLDALSEAEGREAHALGMIDGAWANPELGYTREETLGNGGTGEDYVWLSQRFDLSGRLFLRRDAGSRRASAAAAEGESRRAALAAEVRASFHRALAEEQREAALSEWCAAIEAALQLVERRAHMGDAAPYDELRLRRELRVAIARRDEARAQVQALMASLASLAGLDETGMVLRGQLAPSADGELVVGGIEDSPGLRSLRELEGAADLDREASARSWVPELVLGAGYKGVATYSAGVGRLDGFTLSIGLTVPIFDTGSGAVERDDARLEIVRAHLDLETLTRTAEEHALIRRVRGHLLTLETFEAGRATEGEALVRVATAAYEGGEGTLLELLDAHRSVTDDALLSIEVALEARLALIELRRLRGRE